MTEDEKLILEILLCREDQQLLEGRFTAVFNETKNKFFAYTFFDMQTIDYDDYSYAFENIGSYSSVNTDSEKQKKYISPCSWQMKSARECVEEGIYKSCSIQFTGMLYEGEWFIIYGICYSGEPVEKVEEQNTILSERINKERWNDSLFRPYKSITLVNEKVVRDIELEGYPDTPFIVAELKKEQKLKLNKAFTKYINYEVFIPFVKKLKIKYPQKYSDCISLYGEHYTVFFPESKEHVMMIMMAGNKAKDEYRLLYFLYETKLRKMYQWHYFTPETYGSSFHYSQEIIEELATISDWDSYLFLESSRTMDNANFWSSYVLKREDERYVYLTEMNL